MPSSVPAVRSLACAAFPGGERGGVCPELSACSGQALSSTVGRRHRLPHRSQRSRTARSQPLHSARRQAVSSRVGRADCAHPSVGRLPKSGRLCAAHDQPRTVRRAPGQHVSFATRTTAMSPGQGKSGDRRLARWLVDSQRHRWSNRVSQRAPGDETPDQGDSSHAGVRARRGRWPSRP